MKKRSITLILALLMLVLLFAGCTAGGDTPESPNGGNPVTGGDLTVAIAQDIDSTLDPHSTLSAGTRELIFNIYEGLVKPDPTGEFVPAVASSYVIAETGDSFTFKLREGVKFHNGDIVSVDDVVYSLTRAAGLDTGSALIDGLELVEAVTAADESTIVVTLSEPNVESLALFTAAILPEGNDPTSEVIGTGPFSYVSRSPQENVIIKKFEAYWGAPAYVDSVTYKIYENAETIVMSLLGGSVDLAAHISSAQLDELGNNFNVIDGTMNLVQAVYLNNDVEPLNNADVRRALSYAIDKQDIITLVSGGKGVAIGSSMYPAFSKYFREDLTNYYEYDVEKAKQLLSDAGYPNGFTLEITVPSNYTQHVDTATIVAEQLKKIDVTVNIKQVDWSTWINDVYIGRNFQATVVGVDASVLTARALLERFTSDAGDNFINFSNDEYDAVFLEASTEIDSERQVELYGRMLEILTQDAANLYIQDICDFVVMQKNVGGYEFYPLYVMDMSKVYFTE